MSEDEFLARWSRRKQEARANPAAEKAEFRQELPAAPPPQTAPVTEPEIDLSTLPAIDAITAATDITAFLRKGIPPELSRAALRRAWATDPAIRDFVGLAENAWDFNDPTAMPGFGPLDYSPDQLAALVDRIVGGVQTAVDQLAIQTGNPPESLPQVPPETSLAKHIARPSQAAEGTADVAAAQPTDHRNHEDDCEPVRRPTWGRSTALSPVQSYSPRLWGSD